ncbi:hypothetical protein [Mycolicibacterium gilvum]|uniref:hypothetical protein n=1 Tax=Mycolicibacterium gilvum TaxID=1804 RepID=UPI004045B74E
MAPTELLGAPVVVLDDPIPGSDAGHRLTFVQYPLGALLGVGTQVILTTFDSKGEELGRMLRQYRTSKVGDVLLDRDDSGADVIQLVSHKPGPRKAR